MMASRGCKGGEMIGRGILWGRFKMLTVKKKKKEERGRLKVSLVPLRNQEKRGVGEEREK